MWSVLEECRNSDQGETPREVLNVKSVDSSATYTAQ